MEEIEVLKGVPVDGLSPEHIKIVTYLAHGVTVADTARALGKTEEYLKAVISQHDLRNLVSAAKLNLRQWQQEVWQPALFLATQKTIEILSQPYDEAPPHERREIARMARFVIEQESAANRPEQHNVFAPQMLVTGQSVDVIARRVQELQQENVGGYVQLEDKYSFSSVDYTMACHPDTEPGVLNYDEAESKYQCHVCGKWFANLYDHTVARHGIEEEDYKKAFRLQ